ncbi:placenta-specific protein 1-like, partial [Gracilinanus agilis]|uniref:placenta-specific protein 1-like n=1 Tax=Gracilinanus agilis TaxID=191870 RepID=UPI001CFCAF0C
MKSLLGIAVICLLVCLTWADDNTVSVSCHLGVLRVTVHKYLFNDGVLVKLEELTLGNGCPVNNERWDVYIFQYPVTQCGIQTEVHEEELVYKTFLFYNPINHPYGRPHSYMSVSCVVPSLSLQKPSLVPGIGPQKNDEINFIGMQPVASYKSPGL